MAKPDDLTDLEYARHILEQVLGWPLKGNIELIGDCLRSIGKAKKLTPSRSHDYMVRAIKLAQQQSQDIDRFFFMEGRYTLVRPEKTNGIRDYAPIDAERTKQEQSTPEWEASSKRARELLAKIAGKVM